MDKLTRFKDGSGEVTLTSDGGNSLDTLVEKLGDIEREQILLRKGQEVGIYSEEIEEMEDVEDLPVKETEDA